MGNRRVISTRKSSDGDILALSNPIEYWSPINKDEAISDIESGLCNYFVDLPLYGRVNIRVIKGPNGKYLRTDPDRTPMNNLDHLPDC